MVVRFPLAQSAGARSRIPFLLITTSEGCQIGEDLGEVKMALVKINTAGSTAIRLRYGPADSKMASAEMLIQSMDENGIDRSVVFGFPWRTAELLARHNDYVLDAAARFPDRLLPLACLDLFSQRCVEKAEKVLLDGVRGFGELAVYTTGGNMDLVLDNFKQIAVLCREKDLVLLAHANEPVGREYPGKAPFGLDFYYDMV